MFISVTLSQAVITSDESALGFDAPFASVALSGEITVWHGDYTNGPFAVSEMASSRRGLLRPMLITRRRKRVKCAVSVCAALYCETRTRARICHQISSFLGGAENVSVIIKQAMTGGPDELYSSRAAAVIEVNYSSR